MMQNIGVFGSTGSIGLNTLEVCRKFPEEFKVVALAANGNAELLLRQAAEFKPAYVCVSDAAAARQVEKSLARGVGMFSGGGGLAELARAPGIDKIVMAVSGACALPPVWEAVQLGRTVALANKEALVMAGPLVMARAAASGARVLPIDSEQSAIWQCLAAEEKRAVAKIHLTASGGPLRTRGPEQLQTVAVEDVLNHPRWNMGRKITVDSATLMNKGLELLEAMFLFDLPAQRINVVIHPESIIHSMVEFVDGVVMAQLSATDMRIPIQYALSYPRRLPSLAPPLDLPALGALHFEAPDPDRFPCLRLAYETAQRLGTAPAVMNAANEVAVESFLERRIAFKDIPGVVEFVLSRHRNAEVSGLDDVYAADAWARDEAVRRIATTAGARG